MGLLRALLGLSLNTFAVAWVFHGVTLAHKIIKKAQENASLKVSRGQKVPRKVHRGTHRASNIVFSPFWGEKYQTCSQKFAVVLPLPMHYSVQQRFRKLLASHTNAKPQSSAADWAKPCWIVELSHPTCPNCQNKESQLCHPSAPITRGAAVSR